MKHSYYSKAGKLKGEYYNINTVVELYPYGARYVDLEIDLVRGTGAAPRIIDREELAVLVKEGLIGPQLARKAVEIAEELLRRLEGTAYAG